MTIVITRWLPAECHLLVDLTKLLVVTQLTCGPNKAPGRSLVVWSFTCGPNETPGRSQVVWSFTCGPNEAISRSLVTRSWVFMVLCFWKVLENYMAHMVYHVVSLFISWKAWCYIILLNLSDYCKEDDFERTYIKVSKSTLCFVTCFSINKLAFLLTPLFMLLTGF